MGSENQTREPWTQRSDSRDSQRNSGSKFLHVKRERLQPETDCIQILKAWKLISLFDTLSSADECRGQGWDLNAAPQRPCNGVSAATVRSSRSEWALISPWWISTSLIMTHLSSKHGSMPVRAFGNCICNLRCLFLQSHTSACPPLCKHTCQHVSFCTCRSSPYSHANLRCQRGPMHASIRAAAATPRCSRRKYQSRRAAPLFWSPGAPGSG